MQLTRDILNIMAASESRQLPPSSSNPNSSQVIQAIFKSLIDYFLEIPLDLLEGINSNPYELLYTYYWQLIFKR